MTTLTPLHAADRNPEPIEWITAATRAQLESDLADLPALHHLIDRHYLDLLTLGDRGADGTWTPADPDVLDAADTRHRPEVAADPIGEADLARRIGHRRQGTLPTLTGWVQLADGEMHDQGLHDHLDPHPEPTITTEADWLTRHLDWIGGQQWVIELAAEVRDMVADLESLVGPAHGGPDHEATGTITELAARLDIPASSIYRWATNGWITPIAGKPRQFLRCEVLAIHRR